MFRLRWGDEAVVFQSVRAVLEKVQVLACGSGAKDKSAIHTDSERYPYYIYMI